jgi:NADP-dependent 3-hydroxy acid dehydrogenase YdfG
MSRNIEEKIVVITGASSVLSESTARHLAKLGATVVLGARRKNRLDAIVNDIQAAPRLTSGAMISESHRAHQLFGPRVMVSEVSEVC